MRTLSLLIAIAVATNLVPAHAAPIDDDERDLDDDDELSRDPPRPSDTPCDVARERSAAQDPPAPRIPVACNVARVPVPSVDDVIAAATAAAGLDHDPGRSWVRRARLSGLVPWVTVRTGRTTSWDDQDPDVAHGTTLEVRATWRLDRLAFDARELQIASIDAARRRERRRLATRVIRVYFTWLRANRAAAAEPRWAVHALEAAAELDAMTGGRFSRAARSLARGGLPQNSQ